MGQQAAAEATGRPVLRGATVVRVPERVEAKEMVAVAGIGWAAAVEIEPAGRAEVAAG